MRKIKIILQSLNFSPSQLSSKKNPYSHQNPLPYGKIRLQYDLGQNTNYIGIEITKNKFKICQKPVTCI